LKARGRGERWGKGREGKECTAHIERVYTPVELLDADILGCASPLNAIEDHLLRLGRIVSASFQEAPVGGAEKARESVKTKRNKMGRTKGWACRSDEMRE
jgi:hypothetical protein